MARRWQPTSQWCKWRRADSVRDRRGPPPASTSSFQKVEWRL